jgi:hypothetical protein
VGFVGAITCSYGPRRKALQVEQGDVSRVAVSGIVNPYLPRLRLIRLAREHVPQVPFLVCGPFERPEHCAIDGCLPCGVVSIEQRPQKALPSLFCINNMFD